MNDTHDQFLEDPLADDLSLSDMFGPPSAALTSDELVTEPSAELPLGEPLPAIPEPDMAAALLVSPAGADPVTGAETLDLADSSAEETALTENERNEIQGALMAIQKQIGMLSGATASMPGRVQGAEPVRFREDRALPAARPLPIAATEPPALHTAADLNLAEQLAREAAQRAEAARQAAEAVAQQMAAQQAAAERQATEAVAQQMALQQAEAERQATEAAAQQMALQQAEAERQATEAAARQAAEEVTRQAAAQQAAAQQAAAQQAAARQAAARQAAARQAEAERQAAAEVARQAAARQAAAEQQAAAAPPSVADPFNEDPFAITEPSIDDPFAAPVSIDPYAPIEAAADPYSTLDADDPFTPIGSETERFAPTLTPNSFAPIEDEADPFAAPALVHDPFAGSDPQGDIFADSDMDDDFAPLRPGALSAASNGTGEQSFADIGQTGAVDSGFDAMDDFAVDLPADSPLRDSQTAPANPLDAQSQAESPEPPLLSVPTGPAAAPAGMNEYQPAYEDVDPETSPVSYAPTNPPSSEEIFVSDTSNNDPRRAPRDLLYAIAAVDPEAQAQAQDSQLVGSMRETAIADQQGRRGSRSSLPKLPPLPLDALVPGTPLIGTIFSPSGGVGKSSSAMNLGIYIAAVGDAQARQRRKKGDQDVRVPRVLVLDGDIVQGSLALRLKGDVTPSIHTLMLYLDEREDLGFAGMDRWPSHYDDAPPGERSMRDFVMWPDILPNLNLLAAPEEPDLFFDFGPQEYKEIIQLLGRFYDIIIIDAGTEVVMESQRAWLAHAHEVFLITAPEIDRIYNAGKAARYIARRRPHPMDQSENPTLLPPLATREKLSVVMTKYDADSGLDPEAVMAETFPWLERSQQFYLPDVSREMLRANNQGKFLVLENAVYAKVIGQLAKHLFNRYASQRQRSLSGVGQPPAGVAGQ